VGLFAGSYRDRSGDSARPALADMAVGQRAVCRNGGKVL